LPDFDAIVIGSGISGGWSAKELAERGLKVLVLERGRAVDPKVDFKDTLSPWERPNLDRIPQDELARDYFIQKPPNETSKQFWIKDSEHPYETASDRPFDWVRGYQTGGRSITWGRQSYRLSDLDFEANKRDGHGVDWPIRYADLKPWYDHVEMFAGIAGQNEGLAQLPDGVFQPAFAMTPGELALKGGVESAFPSRKVIHARVAHVTDPTDEQKSLGRYACQSRSYCSRGCAFRAYFSSINATLPAAERTGNYTLVSNAIVQGIDYDAATRRVTGVRVVDANTRQGRTYTARVVFLNASALASAAILLNSVSEAFPTGLANRSDQVGRNLMDHLMGANALGVLPKFQDRYHAGRAPSGIYIPRYANVTEPDAAFVRGFGIQGLSRRVGWTADRPGIGADFKAANRTPAPWIIYLTAFGEMLPNANNRMMLHKNRKDSWGMPITVFDVVHGENERALMQRAAKDVKAMVVAAGATLTFASADQPQNLDAPGRAIHEMGTARMGQDPATSVLNKWSQAHDVANLFVTDGAAMTSSGCQNPSLTYMALSARAANYAADLMKQGIL
jgi:choline dehydrogenase-like flavoprotein